MKTGTILLTSIILQLFLSLTALHADRQYWVLDSGGTYIFKLNPQGEELGYFNAPRTFAVADGYFQYGTDLYMHPDGSASLFLQDINDDEVTTCYLVVFDRNGSLVYREKLGESENEITFENMANDPENGIMYYTQTLANPAEDAAIFTVLKKQNGETGPFITIPLKGADAYVGYFDIDVKSRTVYLVDNSYETLAKYTGLNKAEYIIKSPEGSLIYGFKLDKRDDSVFISYKLKNSDGKPSFVIVKYDKHGKEEFRSKEYVGAYLIDLNPSDGSLYFATTDSVNHPSEKNLIRLNSEGREMFAAPLAGDFIECAFLDAGNDRLISIEFVRGSAYKNMVGYDGEGKRTLINDGKLSLLTFRVKQMVVIPE